jgi:hypothetical protein
MRSSAVLGIFLVALALPLMQNLFQTGSILGRTADISPESLLVATNQERVSHQKRELTLSDKLTQAAHLKAEDMLEKQYWSHTSPDGTEPWHWFDSAEYRYEVAGENLAKNFATDDAVLAAWMNSEEHRKNVLDSRFREVGFAVERGELERRPVTIIVALYGAEAPSFSEAAAQTASRPALLAASHEALGPAARLDIGWQSLTPTALISLLLLLGVVGFSIVAHAYRSKLPQSIKSSWRKHHGMYKALLALGLGLLLILLFSGGQI